MKMKTFKTIFFCAALTLGLGACNNGNELENLDLSETKTVKINLDFDSPSTYLAGSAQGDGTKVNFTSAKLYFATSATGTIVDIVDINSMAVTGDGADPAITHDGDKRVVTKKSIPAIAKYVYVVGNYKNQTGTWPGKGELMTTVTGMNIKVEDQQPSAGGETNAVHMYGGLALSIADDGVSATAGTSDTPLELKTPVARIELSSLSVKTDTDSEITAYDVVGIFINNYYPTVHVDGTTLGDLQTEESSPGSIDLTKNYVKAGASSIYTNSMNGLVYDYNDATPLAKSGASSPYTASAAGVWGYNLLATSGGTDFPDVIIRLKNVKIGGNLLSEDYFLTIKGSGVTGADSKILPANVYSFSDIKFDETNLGVKPYANVVSATVTVTPATWSKKTVGSGL